MKYKVIFNLLLLVLILFTGCQKPTILKPPPVTIPADARIVCIFFDDAFLNQYDVALPILQNYNFKATFAAITDYIGTGHGIMEYMDAGHLEELARLGMDIASHTKTHPRLPTLSDSDLHDEIFDSKKDLEGMGFVVDTFIAPYYEYDDRVIDTIIAANYTCARAGWTWDQVFNPSSSDPKARFEIAAWQIANEDLNYFKAIVDKAGPNSVVCIVYHFISNEGPEGTTTSVANFQVQMGYLKSAGFTVVPLVDIFRQ